ncbi:MAG: peptide ABC transporter substrate-binding protein [Pseudomonadota bacterium]
MDRRALFASGAAAALLAASGVSAQARPQRGGRLRAALSAVAGEGWADAAPSLFRQIARHAVHEGLTEIAADGTLRGNLAEVWDSPDQGRTWHFTLRAARWHDGSDVTPAQVAAALGGAVHKGRVVLTATPADAALPFRMAQPDALIAHPENPLLGTGLYTLNRYEAGRRAILDRVEAHPRADQAGWADVADLSGITAPATRLEALLHDMVDVIDHPENQTPVGLTRLGEALVGAGTHAPREIGQALPLDNFRLAERWWLA